jgi:conjugal transfer pilus assembly protein TraU
MKPNKPLTFFFQCLLIFFLVGNISAYAQSSCKGKFLNPITDVCWSCILPIQLGPVKIGGGDGVKGRDTKNPECPLCFCDRGDIPLAPGIPLAFWEPVRVIEVTRTPMCLVSFGGLNLGSDDIQKVSGYHKNHGPKRAHHSFYNVHYFAYPLIAILELIADLGCMDKGSIDILYLSEFDPMWKDDVLQNLMFPESILYGNLLMQMSCSLDCHKSTTSMPIDSMHWCAGCSGNLYPISGFNADHVGGVRTSLLLSQRVLAKMHRAGLAYRTSTDSCQINGPLCKSSLSFLLKKSQYKLQMTYPVLKNDDSSCIPLGMSDLFYGAGKEFPYDGQDFSYLVWRKRNCCFL